LKTRAWMAGRLASYWPTFADLLLVSLECGRA
jgi:hypothetical protein